MQEFTLEEKIATILAVIVIGGFFYIQVFSFPTFKSDQTMQKALNTSTTTNDNILFSPQ